MNVLWLQSGGCGGCSMSLLCADTTDFQGHLRDGGVNLLWHPSLSMASTCFACAASVRTQWIMGRPVPASMWKRPLPFGPRSSEPSTHSASSAVVRPKRRVRRSISMRTGRLHRGG